jgi:hypothetical protein
VLIGTLNVYEGALIGLAAYLICRRGLARDGVMLLILEAFFLVDITFLNAEIVTSRLGLGTAVDVILFALAIAKLGLITRSMGRPIAQGRFLAIVLQIAVLFAFPIILRWQDHGAISDRFFYGAWWVIGSLIPLSVAISRLRSEARRLPVSPWARKTAGLYAILPWMSLVAHAGILHYVYNVTFYPAEITPVLLGLSFMPGPVKLSRLAARDLMLLRILAPMVALLCSLPDPRTLCWGSGTNASIWLTPTRLALAGAYVTYVCNFAGAYAVYFLATGAAGVAAWVFGPSAAWIDQASWNAWQWLRTLLGNLLPQTALSWGITAIAAAFAFLGIGGAISLGRRNLPTPMPEQLSDAP